MTNQSLPYRGSFTPQWMPGPVQRRFYCNDQKGAAGQHLGRGMDDDEHPIICKVIPTTIATPNYYLGQNIMQKEPRSERSSNSEFIGQQS